MDLLQAPWATAQGRLEKKAPGGVEESPERRGGCAGHGGEPGDGRLGPALGRWSTGPRRGVGWGPGCGPPVRLQGTGGFSLAGFERFLASPASPSPRF